MRELQLYIQEIQSIENEIFLVEDEEKEFSLTVHLYEVAADCLEKYQTLKHKEIVIRSLLSTISQQYRNEVYLEWYGKIPQSKYLITPKDINMLVDITDIKCSWILHLITQQ